MSDVDVLESVLAKDAALVDNVTRDQHRQPTPCPDYDVRTLVNHMVGWLRLFADSADERPPSVEDPRAFTTDDPGGELRAAADDVVRAWRTRGTDRSVRFLTSELPGESLLGMTLMEYVTHGLDLARATGQAMPFTDDELETTLARAQANLPDEYRGEGMPFGPAVPVPDDAPAAHRLLGFMGRHPA